VRADAWKAVGFGVALLLPVVAFAQEEATTGDGAAKPPMADKGAPPKSPAKKNADAPKPPAPTPLPSNQAPIRSAPRPAVEPSALAPLAPPGPPAYVAEDRSQAVQALLRAAEKSPGEDDAARWIEAGTCWVWYAAKRDAAWSRYRFTYEGGCLNGRAEGRGRLFSDRAEEGAGQRQVERIALWHKGVPVAEGNRPVPTTLLVGLPDRSFLAWIGTLAKDEGDVFAVGRADDEGRVAPCKAQSLLAVAPQTDLAPVAMPTMLKNAATLMASACPDRGRALWPVVLVGPELSLVGRQGAAVAQPVLMAGEVKDGLIYWSTLRPPVAPTLIPQAMPVAGAPPLTWTQTDDEFEFDTLVIYGLPAALLLVVLGLLRVARRQRGTPARPPAQANKPGRAARRKAEAQEVKAAKAADLAGTPPQAPAEDAPLDLVDLVPPPAQAKSTFLKGLFARKTADAPLVLDQPIEEEFFPPPPGVEPAPPPPPVAAGAKFARRPSVPISRVPGASSEEPR